ncbi:MAG: pectin acetylesterase-family hydrolase [Halioglobus sp.]|nr:pectin acetylesterase-family hydrolase [Halioglobus sp.]
MLGVLLAACSDTGDSVGDEPFAELYAQGILRYLGVYSPMLSEAANGRVVHSFGEGEGPLCMEGGAYSMSTRDQGSEDLLIFIEGGGAWSSFFCVAITEADPNLPELGIRDPARDNNPMQSFNQVYVPYCDGSLNAGDRDLDTDGDGRDDRFHRGLHNLSAALDVAAGTFPAPRRIVLAGNSGGGFGTIFALPLVRYLYPDTPIDVINDSGVGVSRPGEPAFIRQLLREWNIEAFIPASCANCIPADGHLTDYLVWQMEQDDNFRRAMISYTQDDVLANTFLDIGGPDFEAALLPELQQQEQAFPGRTRSFIPAGTNHTLVQLEPDRTVQGVNLMDWLGFMLSGADEWVSVAE